MTMHKILGEDEGHRNLRDCEGQMMKSTKKVREQYKEVIQTEENEGQSAIIRE